MDSRRLSCVAAGWPGAYLPTSSTHSVRTARPEFLPSWQRSCAAPSPQPAHATSAGRRISVRPGAAPSPASLSLRAIGGRPPATEGQTSGQHEQHLPRPQQTLPPVPPSRRCSCSCCRLNQAAAHGSSLPFHSMTLPRSGRPRPTFLLYTWGQIPVASSPWMAPPGSGLPSQCLPISSVQLLLKGSLLFVLSVRCCARYLAAVGQRLWPSGSRRPPHAWRASQRSGLPHPQCPIYRWLR